MNDAPIIPAASIAPAAIETLLNAAFGPDRHARTAYRLRDGVPFDPVTSLGVIDDGALVGVVLTWPIVLHADGHAFPILLVGPVAVAPDRQRDGLGRRMMSAMLARVGVQPMVMIGDPEYYGRWFGFTDHATAGWDVPGPVERRRLLARHADALPATGRLGPPDVARVAA